MNAHLTLKPMVAILSALSPQVIVGIRTPRNGEKSPLPLAVFLCPLKRNTGLIRVQFSMVRCLRESLKRFARTIAGSTNLIQSTAQCFVSIGGGYSPHNGIPTMSQNKTVQHAQPATPALVLNSETLAELIELLEIAKKRAHELAAMPLYEQQQHAGLDFDLAQVEFPIKSALDLLNGGK